MAAGWVPSRVTTHFVESARSLQPNCNLPSDLVPLIRVGWSWQSPGAVYLGRRTLQKRAREKGLPTMPCRHLAVEIRITCSVALLPQPGMIISLISFHPRPFYVNNSYLRQDNNHLKLYFVYWKPLVNYLQRYAYISVTSRWGLRSPPLLGVPSDVHMVLCKESS